MPHGAYRIEPQPPADQHTHRDEGDHGVVSCEGAERRHQDDDAGNQDAHALVFKFEYPVVEQVLKTPRGDDDRDGAAADEKQRDDVAGGDHALVDGQKRLPQRERLDPRIGERPRDGALVLVKLILPARQKIAQEAEKDDQPRDEDKDLRHDKFFLP